MTMMQDVVESPTAELKRQSEPPHPHHISPVKVILVIILLAAVIGAIGVAGYLPRKNREQAAAAAARQEQTQIPTVTAVAVKRAPADLELLLPGNISSVSEAAIYARASGYVTRRYVDIGDRVRAGQLMAEIETPELDQQVAQARAALAQAKQQLSQTRASLVQSEAQRDLAKLTNSRYSNLVEKGAVARQDADQQESSYRTSEALVTAQQASVGAAEENVSQAQANLDRVIALQDYKNVRAPFAGVVTERNIDVGYLIGANGAGQGAAPLQIPGIQAGASGNEMYRIAQISTLRILINVPQDNAPEIGPGISADVLVNEFPDRVFAGKVTRTANSLDPNSRTLLTQIEIANGDGKLLPGMYSTVRFRSHRSNPPLLVPGDSLIAGNNGSEVAVLQPGAAGNQQARRIHLQQVALGRDYGAETEITAGLGGSELVVVNPGDEVREGNLVIPEMSKPASTEGAGAQNGPSNGVRSGNGRKAGAGQR